MQALMYHLLTSFSWRRSTMANAAAREGIHLHGGWHYRNNVSFSCAEASKRISVMLVLTTLCITSIEKASLFPSTNTHRCSKGGWHTSTSQPHSLSSLAYTVTCFGWLSIHPATTAMGGLECRFSCSWAALWLEEAYPSARPTDSFAVAPRTFTQYHSL